MQNILASTNLLILVARVQGLKGVDQFAKAAESETALSAPINSAFSLHLYEG